jgi:hypothetical protein
MTILSSLVFAACSVVGIRSGTEEPAYTVVEHVGSLEIRQYGARIAAETVIEGQDPGQAIQTGFRRLAGYIFGGNKAQTKIAMTAPVAQSGENIAMTSPVAQARDASGRQVVRFFMPTQSTMATLPVPDDPAVRLVEVPAETMAVLRFTGSHSPETLAERQAELLRLLESSRWHPSGVPVAWFSDPPWTLPWLRRNEVAVSVKSS